MTVFSWCSRTRKSHKITGEQNWPIVYKISREGASIRPDYGTAAVVLSITKLTLQWREDNQHHTKAVYTLHISLRYVRTYVCTYVSTHHDVQRDTNNTKNSHILKLPLYNTCVHGSKIRFATPTFLTLCFTWSYSIRTCLKATWHVCT